MTTINQIEQRILQMDGGEFHKLCDAYLSAVGYGKPNSFGSVSGTNKVRKGTPDTFFERPNGNFVFAEYTTQQDRLLGKLETDLKKCFDEKKTKIPINKIEEIVMCYTGQLEPAAVLSLQSKCQGIKLTLFSLSALVTDLVNQHFLVRHFLGLSLDTGQVIPLEAFPAVYGKSKFANTLETNFHFREKEIEDFSNTLESYDLIVISGKPGVGKSRFALEGCRNFVAKNPEYKAYSIVSQSQELYEDLKEQFSHPGQFLILVDDANRVINFSYFMYLLRNRKDDQKIKIVATVRDYALDKIKNDISYYPHHTIQLGRFTDDQIKELAKDEFGILNSSYLERIVAISGGNPRIAVMTSKVAVEENTLQSINDVSALYDEYFSSIKEDLQSFGESDLLKTAGIIAFLRAVDRTNEQMMASIQQSFHISPDVFWNCAFRLHELEMVDMYEDEVVRISDQVLSTYLFYSAFFKEKVLDFSDILQNYFPGSRSKIVDALNPTLSAFDQNALFDSMRSKVQKIWENFVSLNDDENLLVLAELFWYLLQTETLSFVKRRISQSQFAAADFSQLEQLDDNKLNSVSIITELRLLGYFRHASSDLRNIALEILLEYMKIRPVDILQVLHLLVDDYGFNHFSNQTGVALQQQVIDLLWEHAENGNNELYSRFFISIAKEYLKTHFQTYEPRLKLTYNIYDFDLQPNPDILQLRNTIFNCLFKLYKNYEKHVFIVFENYVGVHHRSTSKEIFSNDSASLIEFIQTNLSPETFAHNVFVNNYLDFLENREVAFDINLCNKFQNEVFLIYKLLLGNRRDAVHYGHEEYQRLRIERFTLYFADFSDVDVKRFIDLCLEIGNSANQARNRYKVTFGFGMAMNVLAETRQGLFEVAIRHYLQYGDKLDLSPGYIVGSYMRIHGKEKTFKFFNGLDYPTKKRWLCGYYQMLSPGEIVANDLLELYQLFEESEYSQLPNDLDFLLNYLPFDHRVVAKVAQLVLDKGDLQYSAWALNLITNPHSDINKHLANLFKDDLQTLTKIYLVVEADKDGNDHDLITLSKILELAPEFINEYIEWIYRLREEGSRWHHDSHDYSTLWRHQNYREIFNKIVELVYNKRMNDLMNDLWHHIEIRQFFRSLGEERLEIEIESKQGQLLMEQIRLHHQNIDFIEFLFEAIAYFPSEQRLRLIFTFLQHNKNFVDFKRLDIEPAGMSWSGSAVPVYQERIDYLKSILQMLNNIELLEHRTYIQQRIDSWERQKNREKKRDFIGDDDFR